MPNGRRCVAGLLSFTLLGCHSTPPKEPLSKPANSSPAAPTATVNTRVVGVPVKTSAVTITPENGRRFATFQPALPGADGPFECTPSINFSPDRATMIHLPVGSRSYGGRFPAIEGSKASVTVIVDSTGKLLRASERRGQPMAPVSVHTANLDSAIAAARAEMDKYPSTIISLDLDRDQGVVENLNVPHPERILGPASLVETLEQIGHPLARAKRVLEKCGGK